MIILSASVKLFLPPPPHPLIVTPYITKSTHKPIHLISGFSLHCSVINPALLDLNISLNRVTDCDFSTCAIVCSQPLNIWLKWVWYRILSWITQVFHNFTVFFENIVFIDFIFSKFQTVFSKIMILILILNQISLFILYNLSVNIYFMPCSTKIK